MESYVSYKIFSKYTHLKHPEDVKETASLAVVKPPEIKYQHRIPARILEGKKGKNPPLSGVQLDAVVMCGESHSKLISEEERQGFVLADSPGLGKGRILAGIILDNSFHHLKRRKAVWITCSSALDQSAIRDLNDVQAGLPKAQRMHLCSLPSNYEKIPFMEGVLFVTYSTLAKERDSRSHAKPPQQNFDSRIAQIIDWVGPDFEGVIVFDEAHKARGFREASDDEDEPKKKAGSNMGSAVVKLQEQLPNARFVYVSATVATNPYELIYIKRIGLWGPNSTFSTKGEFMEFLKKWDIVGCEILMAELKQRGVYLSRVLGFEGVEFENVDAPAPPGFIELYDKVVDMLIELRQFVPKVRGAASQHYAACQRLIRMLCVAAKVDEAIRLGKESIAKGNVAVIGIDSTGQAAYERRFRHNTFYPLEAPFSAFRVTLEDLLIRNYQFLASELGLRIVRGVKPTHRRSHTPHGGGKPRWGGESSEEERDSEDSTEPGPSRKLPKLDGESTSKKTGQEGADSNKSKARASSATKKSNKGDENYIQELLKIDERNGGGDRSCRSYVINAYKEIRDKLPINCVDYIRTEFEGQVAELTGRPMYPVLAKTADGDFKMLKELYKGTSDSALTLETETFQTGLVNVAILSQASSTGISLHSTTNAKMRHHILLEIPFSALSITQQLGRTHRCGQKAKPRYSLLNSCIPGERRFTASLAARMEQLSSLSQGDRRTEQDVLWQGFHVPKNIFGDAVKSVLGAVTGNPKYAVVKLTIFQGSDGEAKRRRYLDLCKSLGFIKEGTEYTDSRLHEMERFFNRILLGPVSFQRDMVGYLDSAVKQLKWKLKEKLYLIQDLNVVVGTANCHIVQSEPIHFQSCKGDIVLSKMRADRSVSFVELLEKEPKMNFRLRKGSNIIYAYTRRTTQRGFHTGYNVWTPSKNEPVVKDNLFFDPLDAFVKVKGKAAQDAWDSICRKFRDSMVCEEIAQNGKCSQGSCDHYKPVKDYIIIHGACLTGVMSHIETVVEKQKVVEKEKEVDIEVDSMKFVRWEAGSILGILVPGTLEETVRDVLLRAAPGVQDT